MVDGGVGGSDIVACVRGCVDGGKVGVGGSDRGRGGERSSSGVGAEDAVGLDWDAWMDEHEELAI